MESTQPTKTTEQVRVAGVSFDPEIWNRLNAEVEMQGHRNRSLVIEKALKAYFAAQDEWRRRAAEVLAGAEVR